MQDQASGNCSEAQMASSTPKTCGNVDETAIAEYLASEEQLANELVEPLISRSF
jgi:hypothetical protein